LKALGKYASEKPEEAKPLAVGAEGYTAAGSLLFHSGPYYTQIVSTKDDPAFLKFAEAIARRIAASQKPGGAGPGGTGLASGTPTSGGSDTPAPGDTGLASGTPAA